MGRLFGTDGVRGIANTELDCTLAFSVGRALATVMAREKHHRPKFIVGKDTRISSNMLEAAVCAGICSSGGDVVRVGVVSTPAVAFLVNTMDTDAGVMLSASHNPYEFNGIKTFGKNGLKLSDTEEEEIESIILDTQDYLVKSGSEIGRIEYDHTAIKKYENHIVNSVKNDLSGLKVLIDCSNGSASATAGDVFARLKVDAQIIHNAPDGININNNCGSTHIESLAVKVKEGNYDAGFAFDGDADRCLAVDKNGNIVNGDKLIALLALHMKNKGELKNTTAVVTIMSNLGFFKFAEANGIKTDMVKVGDRYVLESLTKNDYSIGGEQSGHIILRDFTITGDGQMTAAKVMEVMKETGKSLAELASVMEVYPQTTLNIHADAQMKAKLTQSQEIAEIKQQLVDKLEGNGRIVLRPSGTEPLIRIMVEGKTKEITETIAKEMADAINERLK